MDKNQNKTEFQQAGYRLLNILLIESNFKREINIDFQAGQPENEVDISLETTLPNQENIFTIYFSLNFRSLRNEKEEVVAFLKMGGVFQRIGEPDLKLESFSEINGPAIMFPFLRENLASLTQKAGINQVLLPPLNFTKKK